MEAWIDGEKIANWTVANDTWHRPRVTVDLAAGGHTLELRYTNDNVVGGDDRNLHIDVTKIDRHLHEIWRGQAEAMTCSVGNPGDDPKSSNDTRWNLQDDGYCQTPLTVDNDGTHRFRIRALGDPADGSHWPYMEAWIDGTLVKNWTVDSSDWKTYTTKVDLSEGAHNLEIRYTNNHAYNGDDNDLLLDAAYLDERHIVRWVEQAEAMNCDVGDDEPDSKASSDSYWNLWTEGSCQDTASVDEATNELRVIARGEPANGQWPYMEAYVNGNLIANRTVNHDYWEKYTIPLSVGAGSHDVEIRFTNDAYTDTEDRNLHVDVVSMRG
jgi:uncharacterized protein YndB with AHSA1/START domain